MKVAYLLTWSGDQRSGVFKKVADQVEAWSRLGLQVGIFVATTHTSSPDWAELPESVHVEIYTHEVHSLVVQRRLVRSIHRWGPDVTYVRTTIRHAAAFRLLGALPHVIEVQTDDLAESEGLSRARHYATLSTRRLSLGKARGMVFVSQELSTRATYDRFTANRIVIGNGATLRRISPLPPPDADSRAPRLAFVGSPGIPWHGLDDVIRLAELRPGWSFDLIGPEATSTVWPSNVSVHGALHSDDYNSILAKSDAAISTLALYRNRMEEASPLKSREYLALGLPVIGSYRDTDIPEFSDVYLRLRNEPCAIITEILRVEAFLDRWRGQRVPRDEILYLDTERKERQRIAFLQQVL